MAGAGGAGCSSDLDLAGGAPLRVMQWKNDGQLAAIDALIDSLASAPADPLVLATRWEGLLKSKPKTHFIWKTWWKVCSAGCLI